MDGEKIKPILRKAAINTALTVTLVGLTTFAASGKLRKKLAERSDGICEQRGCSRSRPNGDTMEISHKNHKRRIGYNSLRNALFLCLPHHAQAHIKGHGKNGLCLKDNRDVVNGHMGILKRKYPGEYDRLLGSAIGIGYEEP